jgi:hypothetical protein
MAESSQPLRLALPASCSEKYHSISGVTFARRRRQGPPCLSRALPVTRMSSPARNHAARRRFVSHDEGVRAMRKAMNAVLLMLALCGLCAAAAAKTNSNDRATVMPQAVATDTLAQAPLTAQHEADYFRSLRPPQVPAGASLCRRQILNLLEPIRLAQTCN